MSIKKIALGVVALTAVLVPAAASAAGGYIGYTITGEKHWIPDPSQWSLPWFQKWLANEKLEGREYKLDSAG